MSTKKKAPPRDKVTLERDPVSHKPVVMLAASPKATTKSFEQPWRVVMLRPSKSDLWWNPSRGWLRLRDKSAT